MSVRHKVFVLLALGLAGLLGGCGGDNGTNVGPEGDDQGYRDGQQFAKQGRTQEALAAYLKVIEKRGDQASAESHLEVGLILQQTIKDPLEAIHHFRKYLEQQPNSKQAPFVKQRIELARREFARTLPADPTQSQGARLDSYDQIDRLQRENEQLRAELIALKGGSEMMKPTNVVRATLSDPFDLKPAPVTAPPAEDSSPMTIAPIQVRETESPVVQTAPPASGRVAPTKPTAPSNSGRTYTVGPKETLWGVATKAYGTANNARVRAIAEANRDLLPSGANTPLKAGMTLKIP